MKVRYNAPVILTYALAAAAVQAVGRSDIVLRFFSSPSVLDPMSPIFYLKLVSYVLGHAGWRHLWGNLLMILLVGPLLEEKYGSLALLEMIVVTAVSTALLNAVLFSSSLVGGSGIAFMAILLSSFSNIRTGEIPLTFVLVSILFIGNEVVSSLRPDTISQFSHLAGGFVGAAYGFFRGGRRRPVAHA